MVLSGGLFEDLVMVESTDCWFDVVSLSHLEVLSEVLVSAPPVGVNKARLLVSSNLMEVRVSNVVLFSISWHSEFSWDAIVFIGLTDTPVVLSDHVIFLHLSHQVKVEGLVQVKDQERPKNSNSVLVCKLSNLPEGVAKWVFEPSYDVLEHSPFLSVVSWLLGSVDKLGEITISFSGKCSSDHISSFVHVWVSIHKAFNTSESLSQVGFRVLSIVEVFGHIYLNRL